MLENKDILVGKIKIGKVEHEISLLFDRVYKEWIQQLLLLIRKIGCEQSKYILCSQQLGYNFLQEPEYSFLGTSCTAINQFLYLLVKDELSEATANFALPDLCKNLSDDTLNISYEDSLQYIARLLNNDFNSALAPYFLDTYIGVWSCFESAICSITQKDEAAIKEKLANRKYKEYKKFVKNILLVDLKDILSADKIDKFLGEKKNEIIERDPIYVSFPDRTNYLFMQMKGQYDRDIDQDKKTLLFLGALRNTVHNNGKHLKKDMKIELGGKAFCLKENQPVYFERHIDVVILLNELLDIYFEILRYVTQRKILGLDKLQS